MRKSHIKNYIKTHSGFFLFLCFYIVLVGYKLIFLTQPFYDWDESLYVQSGKEMFERKFFLFPVWQGEVWLDKPPLVPFLYGFIMKLFFFISPEVSTRLFTLTIASIVLLFVYILYFRVVGKRLLVFLTVVLTAFTPIFLQRAQMVNLDIFLLLGWLGYMIFFDRFWVSLIFAAIAILSKSLIGFYPLAMMSLLYLYLFLRKKIKRPELQKNIVKIVLHGMMLSVWFIAMLILYKKAFFMQHIIESHFRRVSSSIEFHFGKRTFYIDLIRAQFGIFFWVSIVGFFLFTVKYFKNEKKLFWGLYLLPWFFFLNLTKTKIFWYIIPIIPQFAFLSVFPITLLSKKKLMYMLVGIIVCIYIIYRAFIPDAFFSTFYSKREHYYDLALFARAKCDTLSVLLNPDVRESFATLEGMRLLITTSKWWGDHPSMVYYFGKRVNFIYDTDTFKKKIGFLHNGECFAVYEEDYETNAEVKDMQPLKKFGQLYLFKK